MKRFYSLLVSLVLLVCTGANVSPFIVECNAQSLPSGYERLEYVQSTGSQYINTGVYPCQSTKIETKASIEATMSWGGIICAEDGTFYFGIAQYGSDNLFHVEYGHNAFDNYQFTKGVTYDLELDRNKFYVNHQLVGTIANDISEFRCARTLHLFKINTSNVSGYSKIKLYFAKIYEDDVLVRYYVPCKNVDGKVGFYDFVNKEFKASETSTALVAGPDYIEQEKDYEIVKDIRNYKQRNYTEVFNLKDSSWYMLNSNNEYEKYGVVEVLPTNYKWETLTSEVANDSHKPMDFNCHIAFRTLRITPDDVNKSGHIYLRSTNTDHDFSYTDKEYYNIQTGSNGDFRLTRLYPGRYNYTKTFTYSVGSSSEFVKDGDSYLYTFDQNMYFNGVDGNDARISSVEVLVPNFDEVSTYEGKIVVMGDSLFRFKSGEWHSIGVNKKGWVDYSHDFDINAKFSSVRIDLSQSLGFGMCWCIFTNGDEKYWMASPWDGAVRTLWDDQRFSISSFPKVDGTSATYQIDFSSYDSAPFHLDSPAQYNYAFFTTQVYLVDYPATYAPKAAPEDVYVGLRGAGTESDPYQITNAEELAEMANYLGESHKGTYFRVMNDIDLTEWIAENNPTEGWSPIGVQSDLFMGNLDGDNHTISGLYINRPSLDYVGLFGYIESATITNLNVLGSSVSGRNQTGGLFGEVTSLSVVDNCKLTLSGATGLSGRENVGGLIGSIYNSTISNSDYTGKVKGSYNDVGGLAGRNEKSTFNNCSAFADIDCPDYDNVGGIIGYSHCDLICLGCNHKGEIIGGYYVGGIVGNLYSSSNNQTSESISITISSCGHNGNISGANAVAGLVGRCFNDCSLKNVTNIEKCFVSGRISGTDYIGGLFGDDPGSYNDEHYLTLNFMNCYAMVDIIGNNHVGGLAGNKDNSSGKIQYCYVSGTVKGNNYVGGIVGEMQSGSLNNVLSNCIILDSISATSNYGRVCGYKNGGTIGEIGTPQGNFAYENCILKVRNKVTTFTDSELNGSGIGLSAFKKSNTFIDLGWDFEKTWKINNGLSFPYLAWENPESHVKIVDGEVLDIDQDTKYDEVVYIRTFNNTAWQALYVPFSIPVETLTDNGMEVAELNNVHMYDTNEDGQFDKTTIEFLYLRNGATTPNYPYLIKPSEAGEVNLSLPNTEVCATTATQIECATTRQTFKIKGTYTGVSGAEMYNNNYYAMGGGSLVRVEDATSGLKPQRWYLSIENKDGSPVEYFAPSMRIMINGVEIEEEETTGIHSIVTSSDSETVYTLDGRRMNPNETLPAGIYVKNHQKMIVR